MEETKPILTKPIKATLIFAAYKNLDVPCSHVSPFCVKKKKLIPSPLTACGTKIAAIVFACFVLWYS